VLIEEGEIRTAIVVVPDRQLSLAIGKEGQNARLAAKLTGWRIDIKSETEAATEGLAEIKRQQMQMIRTRTLQEKAAALPPTDDLLSRAEWLLRERDKSQATLETAARLLAEAEQNRTELPVIEGQVGAPEQPAKATTEAPGTGEPVPTDAGASSEAPALPDVEAVTAPTEVSEAEATPEAAPSAKETAKDERVDQPASEAPWDDQVDVQYFADAEFIDEDEDSEEAGGGAKKPAKKGKKAAKKRELVFDENLGEVVARRKRKPGRGGWGDLGDY